MTWETYLLIVFFNLLSLGFFFAVRKTVIHVTKSYTRIVGKENRHMVLTTQLALIRFVYLATVIGLMVFSTSVLYYYFL